MNRAVRQRRENDCEAGNQKRETARECVLDSVSRVLGPTRINIVLADGRRNATFQI